MANCDCVIEVSSNAIIVAQVKIYKLFCFNFLRDEELVLVDLVVHVLVVGVLLGRGEGDG